MAGYTPKILGALSNFGGLYRSRMLVKRWRGLTKLTIAREGGNDPFRYKRRISSIIQSSLILNNPFPTV
jgi:hypothetical protein